MVADRQVHHPVEGSGDGIEALETLSQIVNAKQDGTGVTYVLNMKSMKFHDPACSGTRDIKISLNYTGTREEITALGFEPCGRCKP